MYRSCINRLCIDYVKIIKLLNGQNVSYKSLVRQIPQPFDGESVLSVFSANIEPCQRIWEQRSFNPWLMNRRIMRYVDIAIVGSWTSMRKGHVQRIHSSTCNHRCNWWPTCMAIDFPIFSHPFYMICLLNIGYSRYPHVWRVYPKHLSLAVSFLECLPGDASMWSPWSFRDPGRIIQKSGRNPPEILEGYFHYIFRNLKDLLSLI